MSDTTKYITVYSICSLDLDQLLHSNNVHARFLLSKHAFGANYGYNTPGYSVAKHLSGFARSETTLYVHARLNGLNQSTHILITQNDYNLLRKAMEEDPNIKIQVIKCSYLMRNTAQNKSTNTREYCDCVIL